MTVMTLAIELDIGRSFLLQPETTPILMAGPSDRTAIAGAAMRSRRRNRQLGRGPSGTFVTLGSGWAAKHRWSVGTATGTRRVRRPMRQSVLSITRLARRAGFTPVVGRDRWPVRTRL